MPVPASLVWAAGMGFWVNVYQAVRETKPHFFMHNCAECQRAGILKCRKCDGRGFVPRARPETVAGRAISLTSLDVEDEGGCYGCQWCKGKGVQACPTCNGKGHHFHGGFRSFGAKPVFEGYHWFRLFGKDRSLERLEDRKQFDKNYEMSDEMIRVQKKEKAERRAAQEKKDKEKEKKAKLKAKEKEKKDKEKAKEKKKEKVEA
mmetsp:Transcript_21670/g.53691  ORF Transcript_21670/g.53691 Transcript_21670/m.53691 type:complete len:204 (+) Transcript_21670:235-846(+)|eukprot:CAMPEP_0197575174 /NCGR_PEP_ID=MMETSP1326-20131121/655_1 /TAXON_ID=1155430 /ORGANISM="Genus nov. species nov., Strain RCC2288" /LENGTH=203 /DNA_ID=CAMNT_0043137889 /DNA_START=178 /DNA_END=789 /DNA_ORIENTATION=-